MKTLIITCIAAMSLTHAAHARTWAWFHGDIGLASPFAAFSKHATTVTRQSTTKSKAVQKRAFTKSKISSADKRMASR
jgi:hypothetical protein